MRYWYELIQRPPDLGCQPNGVVEIDVTKGRHGIVAYDRELTKKELSDFAMRRYQDD